MSTTFAGQEVGIKEVEDVKLLDYIHAIESELGMKAQMNMLSIQLGDVPAVRADIDDFAREVGFRPATPV